MDRERLTTNDEQSIEMSLYAVAASRSCRKINFHILFISEIAHTNTSRDICTLPSTSMRSSHPNGAKKLVAQHTRLTHRHAFNLNYGQIIRFKCFSSGAICRPTHRRCICLCLSLHPIFSTQLNCEISHFFINCGFKCIERTRRRRHQ